MFCVFKFLIFFTCNLHINRLQNTVLKKNTFLRNIQPHLKKKINFENNRYTKISCQKIFVFNSLFVKIIYTLKNQIMGATASNQKKNSLITNLEKETTLQVFLSTEIGQKVSSTLTFRKKFTNYFFKSIIAISVLSFLIVMFSKNLFNGIIYGVIFFAVGYILYQIIKSLFLNPAIKNYFNKRWDYTLQVANEISNSIGSYYYAFQNGYVFFFSEDSCIYLNIDNGDWINIVKKDIKKVNIEHVYLGSTTVSQSNTSGRAIAWTNNFATYSGSTTTTSHTTSKYEWRLDVLSGFSAFPNLTVVFPDDKEGEEYAKKACALLMP